MFALNPDDSLERQNQKLMQIVQSLMRRVEQKTEDSGLAYQQFERAALLETEVRERTRDLERALDLLQEANNRLGIANAETETARANLTEAIETINEGFALFEQGEGLVLRNSRFCRDFNDVAPFLVGGLSFEEYVKLISASTVMALPDGQTPAEWADARIKRHGDDHVVFNVRLRWDRWLQVSEHRTTRGGTVILQTDVTSIIRQERRARDRMRDQQAEMLQATLDHLNQGVCIFDKTQTLVGWNSRMDGLFASTSQRTALGMHFSVLLERLKEEMTFVDAITAEALRDWADTIGGRAPLTFEVQRGAEQTFSVFAQEMPDRGLVISFTDVTAERAAARTLSEMNELLEQRVADRTRELGLALAEAERANASKSRFVAAASHDLLQPLSAAKLFVSSLSEQTDPASAQAVMDKAEMALNSVEQFISALLDISKLDAGKAVFDVQPLCLSEIFLPLRTELMPLAQQKGIDLRILDCGLTVLSDPGYLRRIVQNLLTNAIRYTDQGRVLAGVRRVGDTARIEVWDTGHGIAHRDQQTIFREFERISPSNADTGLGLGLSIVERACSGLDHPLHLVSEPGRGSCFMVEVPIQNAPAADAGPLTVPLLDQLLMLVEDDPVTAEVTTDMIEALGATVIHAHNAAEALAILEEIQLVPDALLIKHQLDAGQDGIQFYQDITARYGTVPAAILTRDQTGALQKLCAQRELDVLALPLNQRELSLWLAEMFSAQRLSA